MPYMVELINNIRARIYENTYLDKILRVSQSTAGSWNFSVGVQILIFTEPANLNTISPSLEKKGTRHLETFVETRCTRRLDANELQPFRAA